MWERVFGELSRDRDNEYLMIDSAIVRALTGCDRLKGGCNDQALGGAAQGSGDAQHRWNGGAGRSRGGLTTKWHIAVDTLGRPVRFILTAGQRHHATQALALMEGLPVAHVLADRAYDAHAILDYIEASGAKPIIPQKTGMSRRRAFDPAPYKHRNRIERTIGKLKQLRRIAARHDRNPANYLAGLYLASLSFWP